MSSTGGDIDNIVKKVAESPAIAVEKVSSATTNAVKTIPRQRPFKVARKYWGTLGPGLTTGASGDDPSGIATYSQVGAVYGFQYLWMALYMIPFMIVAQEMCARIAQVTGRGLAGNMRLHYPKWLVSFIVLILFVANTISIAADIAGMSAAAQLLLPNFPFWFFALAFTMISLFLIIKTSYAQYSKYLKYLALVLFAYIVTAFFVEADWLEITLSTLVPRMTFTPESIFLVTATVGATLSPYLLFWQASQEIEEQKVKLDKPTLANLAGTDNTAITRMRKDVSSGMIFSNLITFFIIAVTGAVFFPEGITITTAAEAAEALRPFAGDYAYLLFSLGIIGTGMLALPVLAGSASYAFAEAFSLSQGLDKELKRALGFYGVIILAMFIGLAINFMGIDPIKALIFAGFLNGIVTPIIITFVILVANNPKVMGEWKNGPWSNGFGWFTAIVMYIATIASVIGLLI